jgi:uncharacterized membrane protein
MARLIIRILLATLFLLAGTVHLLNPNLFLPIMPSWVPAPMAAILISGVTELAGGLGLLVPQATVQRAAGWGLLLLLLAVFPANVHMAAAHIRVHGFPSHSWMSWARLPLQPILMLMVSWSAGIGPRPTRRKAEVAP